MPYNAPQSSAPVMNSSGQWMTIAQIIAGLVGGNSTPAPATANQNNALAAGQGPLNANSANAWANGMTGGFPTFTSFQPQQPSAPGYNTNQFGVPLGTQQSNSY